MGLVFGIILFALSLAAAFFFGFSIPVMAVLIALWLGALIIVFFSGHRAFGSGVNTDAQLMIAALGITAAILVPHFVKDRNCRQAQNFLKELSEAEQVYFSKNGTYAHDIKALDITVEDEISVTIIKADKQSFVVKASHSSCDQDADGKPDVFTLDSAKGEILCETDG